MPNAKPRWPDSIAGIHSFFCASSPPTITGMMPRSLAMIDVVMPEQPQERASVTRQLSTSERPTPP